MKREKNRKRYFIFLSCFLVTNCCLLATAVFGASYYVSNSGNDNAAGTQTSPWARCPGLLGWSGSKTLSAGDIVYFDSAGTWGGSGSDQLLTLKGGVTYDGSSWSAGTGGTRALLKTTGYTRKGVVTLGPDHATIPTVLKGFELDGKNSDCTGVQFMPYSTLNLTGAVKRIENCIIHDCGRTTSSYSYGIQVSPFNGYRISNVEIINCTVYNVMRSGIVIYPGTNNSTVSNVLVRGCDVYNTGLDLSAAGMGIALKNHTVNVIVEYNYIHDVKSTYKHAFLISTNQVGWLGNENAKIRYNIIANCKRAFYFGTSGLTDVQIYGNLFINNTYTAMDFDIAGATNQSLKFYNNTFYHNCQSGSAEVSITNSSAFKTFEFVNNVIYSNSGKIPFSCDNGSKITMHSNNIYYRPDGGTLVRINSTNYSSGNLATWESTAYSSNPNFKNTSNLPGGIIGTYGTNMVPDADGLSIETGNAINNGADLGAVFNGAINLSGKSGGLTRPQIGGWDIGAYEYITTGADATPPSAPAVVKDGTGTYDIDSTALVNQLSANWLSSNDLESGISRYEYAIGTSPGGSNIVDWISNGTGTSVTKSGLSLVVGQTYYVSVKAVNGVGLESNPTNSDGQTVSSGGGGNGSDNGELGAKVYPNPFIIGSSQMTFSINDTTGGKIKIYTINGKLVKKLYIPEGVSQGSWNITNEDGNGIKSGLYIYTVTDGNGNKKTGKLAISH
jgi:hypothetical protein